MRKFMNWWLAFQEKHCSDVIAIARVWPECDAIQFKFILPVVVDDEFKDFALAESKDFALAYNCAIDDLEADIAKQETKLVEVIESLRSRVRGMQVKGVQS